MSPSARDLGQFFTPLPLCRLAAAAVLRDGAKTVLDPTCGTGNMLRAAHERLGRTGQLLGLELDPVLADQAREAVPSAQVHTTSIFDAAAQAGWSGAYDAVLGNPPYVRYNVAAPALHARGSATLQAVVDRHPSWSPTRQAAWAMRCSLVGADIDEATAWLRHPASAPEALRPWVQLVAAWSGRSDLSVPVWLASLRALRPGGRLAFVAAESPVSRGYGRWLRYAWLRFATPELVVHPGNGAWFADAQVPVALRVLRGVAPHEAPPLSERRDDAVVRIVHLDASVDLSTEAGMAKLAWTAEAPLGQAAAVSSALRQGEGPWRVQEVALRALAEQVLGELHEAAPDVLARLEHRRRVVGGVAPRPAYVEAALDRTWRTLPQLGLTPRQGLRTGYNPFFYAQTVRPGRVRLSPELGGAELDVEAPWVRPALRYQRELEGPDVEELPVVWWVLVTQGGVTPDELAAYHDAWVAAWARDGVRVVPPAVQDWVARGQAHTVPRNGQDVPMTTLSAVAPNSWRPDPSSFRHGDLPPPPRGFHQLRLTPRHTAPLVLGRLVNERPRPALNLGGRLVDANFSTFELADGIDPHAAFALLSSTAAWAAMEACGTAMGGGALKVEATHLRQVRLPEVWARPELADLGRELVADSGSERDDVLAKIDRVVAGSDSAVEALRAQAVAARSRRGARSRGVGG